MNLAVDYLTDYVVNAIACDYLAEAEARRLRANEWQAKADQVYAWGHPWQRQVCDDPARRIAVLTGGRCGKTTAIQERLLRRLLRAPTRCLYIALTRDSAVDLFWDPLKDDLERLRLTREGKHPDVKLYETTLRARFANGSRLQLVGADDKKQIEKLRGVPRHEVWIDETASFDRKLLEHLIERVLGARLGDYKGVLGIAGTPGHILDGIFYEVTKPGSARSRHYRDRNDERYQDWLGWSLHTWTAEEAGPYAPRIASYWEDALERKARNGWSDTHPVFMREDRGLWAADDTDVVFRYSAELNQWDPPKSPLGVAQLPDVGRPGHWRYVWGVDLGSSDPFALEVFGWNSQDPARTLYHVYEFTETRMYARLIAELLIGAELKHEKPGGIVGALGWPDGSSVDLASLGGAVLDELLQVYGIKLEPAEVKDKFGAIELSNGDLLDGRIKILKGSVLEQQLLQNQWVRDDFGQRRRNKGQRDDAADAFVYARLRAHHLLSQEAPTPKPAPLSDWHRAGTEAETAPAAEPGEFDHMLSNYDPDYWGDD